MSRTFDCAQKGEPGNDVVATGVRDMIAITITITKTITLITDVVSRP